jgi:hypothetical protein
MCWFQDKVSSIIKPRNLVSIAVAILFWTFLITTELLLLFLDQNSKYWVNIEGAFDRTSFNTIKQAAERHGTEPAICRWICSVGKQEHNCYIVVRDAGRVCGQGVSARRCAFASAVGPGHGRSSLGAQRQWLLHCRICCWYSNPNQWEIPSDCVRGLTKSPLHSPTMVQKNKVFYQPKIDCNPLLGRGT